MALIDTSFEGLDHVRQKLSEGKFEETILLFSDTLQAFANIEMSLKNLPDKIVKGTLEKMTEKVRKGFDITVFAYESGNLPSTPNYKPHKERLTNSMLFKRSNRYH